jgi:hypothetical protein
MLFELDEEAIKLIREAMKGRKEHPGVKRFNAIVNQGLAKRLQEKVLADFKKVAGRVIILPAGQDVQGYWKNHDDASQTVRLETPAVVKVDELKDPPSNLFNWAYDCIDPVWDITPAERHPQLNDMTSLWLEAKSYSTDPARDQDPGPKFTFVSDATDSEFLEQELVVRVDMSDIVHLAMNTEGLEVMGQGDVEVMLAEHLVNKLADFSPEELSELIKTVWIDRHEIIEERGPKRHRCGNCCKNWMDSQIERLWPHIPDLGERLDVGMTVPSAECPECQALCYLEKSYDEAAWTRDMEKLLEHGFKAILDGVDERKKFDRTVGMKSKECRRIEVLTLDVKQYRWSGKAAHLDLRNNVTRREVSPDDCLNLVQVVEWLNADHQLFEEGENG